jgi:hypothetical protein
MESIEASTLADLVKEVSSELTNLLEHAIDTIQLMNPRLHSDSTDEQMNEILNALHDHVPIRAVVLGRMHCAHYTMLITLCSLHYAHTPYPYTIPIHRRQPRPP